MHRPDGIFGNAFPPGQPRRDGDYRANALAQMPWLADWLLPAGHPPKPRDGLRTPYALASLGVSPNEAPFLQYETRPWRALRKLAQLHFMTQPQTLAAPLHAAVVFNRLQEAHECMAAAGPSLNEAGPSGLTALGLAALLGRDDLLLALLAHGADVHGPDVLDNTPLHWACIAGDANIGALLRDHAADDRRPNLLRGSPADYHAAWQVQPPNEFAVHVELRDGARRVIETAAEFRQVLGFTYMPSLRPGIDFFMNLIHGMASAPWVQSLRQELTVYEPFPFDTLIEAPLLFKDYGAPLHWGVAPREPLERFRAITTYAGDLLHNTEAMVRYFNGASNAYVCSAQPSPKLQELLPSCIDAQEFGAYGGRLNSVAQASDGNLEYACRFWRGLPLVLFFAGRSLQAGEQLGWYYGDGYWNAQPEPPTPFGT